MAIHSSEQLAKLLTRIRQGESARAYLVVGERFLCQQAAEALCQALLAGGGTVHPVDGDQEPFATTLHKLTSFSLFPGRQVYRVADTRLLHSVKVAESLWKKVVRARQNNEPDKAARWLQNMLESAGLKPDDPENDPGRFSPAQWKKVFGFAQPQEDLGWTGGLLAAAAAPQQETAARSVDDPAALLEQKLAGGILSSAESSNRVPNSCKVAILRTASRPVLILPGVKISRVNCEDPSGVKSVTSVPPIRRLPPRCGAKPSPACNCSARPSCPAKATGWGKKRSWPWKTRSSRGRARKARKAAASSCWPPHRCVRAPSSWASSTAASS